MIDLFEELGLAWGPALVDNTVSVRLKHTPWVGPLAYLHILFKPAETDVVAEADRQLNFPPSVRTLYKMCNGASLFSCAIEIFGCVPSGTLLNRSDPLTLPPFNVVDSNLRRVHDGRFLLLGSYGNDGSQVVVERDTEAVLCFEARKFDRIRQRWTSVDEWLRAEIQRLTNLVNSEGELLTVREQTLPGAASGRVQ